MPWTRFGGRAIWRAIVWSGFAATGFTHIANAQQRGWAVDRLEPAPAGDLFFHSQFPDFRATAPVSPRFGLTTAYAYRPLVATVDTSSGGSETIAVQQHVLVTHFQANVHIAQRLGIDVALPVYWFSLGASDPFLPVRAYGSPVLGDTRVGVRVRLFGEAARDPISVHLGATGHLGFLGVSDPGRSTSDGGFRARVFAVAAGTFQALRWSVTAGYHARPGLEATYAAIGSSVFANAALGVMVARERALFGLDAAFATDVDAAFQSGRTAIELLAVARALLADNALQFGVGVGPGLTRAAGTPTLRATFAISYTPPLAAARAARAVDDEPHVVVHDAGGISHASASPAPAPSAPFATASGVPNPTEPSNPQDVQGFCAIAGGAGCSVSDRDGDHVFEPIDQCPDEAAGQFPNPERVGCPDGDRDHDTVTDHRDQCIDEPRTDDPDPSRLGCPLPDRDRDRIADAVDHCPDQPGAPHPNPTLNGCPGLVQLDAGILRILQPVFFAQGRDRIEPRSFPVLQGVVDALQARTDIRHVIIEGHTDDVGNDELNVDLSQRRAAAVLRWLVERGADPSRLHAQGLGPSRPLAPVTRGMTRAQINATRARNRRVQFEVVTDDATSSAAPSAASASPAPANATRVPR